MIGLHRAALKACQKPAMLLCGGMMLWMAGCSPPEKCACAQWHSENATLLASPDEVSFQNADIRMRVGGYDTEEVLPEGAYVQAIPSSGGEAAGMTLRFCAKMKEPFALAFMEAWLREFEAVDLERRTAPLQQKTVSLFQKADSLEALLPDLERGKNIAEAQMLYQALQGYINRDYTGADDKSDDDDIYYKAVEYRDSLRKEAMLADSLQAATVSPLRERGTASICTH